MSSLFERLPLELHRAIISEYAAAVDEENLAFQAWSLTCSYFHALLTPIVFARIRLHRTEGSGYDFNALAGAQMAAQVKRVDLLFKPHQPHQHNDNNCDAEYWEDCCTISPAVEKALTNLRSLPNLEKLHIEFWVPFDWTELPFPNEEEELVTSQDVIDAERNEDWRAMMARVYESVATNAGESVKELTIQNFVLREVSTFSTPVWHRFLNQLRKFQMDIPGV